MAVLAAEAQNPAAPKVVINVLIDQLRTDYLQAFMPLYGEGGFKRLMENGHIYMQAGYPIVSVDRASATATVATGSTPFYHGIVGQQWFERSTLRRVDCVDDASCKGIATEYGASPQHLAVSTIGDELKVATDGKSLVYSIAPFRDAAILAAGHAADGAVWLDDDTGNWCTSSYYGSLPGWANARDLYNPVEKLLKNYTWKPSTPPVEHFRYFLSNGETEPFKHKFSDHNRYRMFKTSAPVNDEIAALTKECIWTSDIGNDAFTDYLSVMFYAGNYRHLPVSQAPQELQDTYVRIDKALSAIIEAVDQKVGLANALFVVTSTGHCDEEPTDLAKYRIPTGTFDIKRSAALLNMYLMAVYGQGNYVEACFGPQIYLNKKLIEDKQLYLTEVLNRTQDFLIQLSGVKDVYSSQRILLGAWTPDLNRLRNTYNPQTSGDILIQVAPGWRFVNEDTGENHIIGSGYVPFPIIFFGYNMQATTVTTPVTVDYIAPTLSKAMRIRAPNACMVTPLSDF